MKSHTKTNTDTAPLRTRPPYLLTAREAAEALRISPRHLADLAEEGLIPRVRLGRRVIYRWPAIELALARLEKGEL